MSGIREVRRLKYWLENSDNDNMHIAWYSEKQRNVLWESRNTWKNRYKESEPVANVWITPDNKEIIATSVTKNYENNCGWDDMKCLGPVIKWKKCIYHIHKRFPEYDIIDRTDTMFPSYKKMMSILDKNKTI